MTNKLSKFLGILGLIAVLGGLYPLASHAQSAPLAIAPDDGRADDIIVQLNNLTIQSVNPSAGVIYAARTNQIYCTQYNSLQSSAGFQAPCPMGSSLYPYYQIAVAPDTILLYRNRTRASFSDFAVGDHINVYGFVDTDTNFVYPLIVRDLDKPVVGPVPQPGGYVQVNNVQVLSNPSGNTFFVLAKDYGCVSYGYNGIARGSVMACPMGTDSAAMSAAYPTIAPPPSPGRIYRVDVMPGSQVLDLYRRPISVSQIQSGHYVNIYGYFNAGTATIQSQIVRDLSLGNVVIQNNSIGVSVVDQDIRCITAPCGQVGGVSVMIYNSAAGIVRSGTTGSDGRVQFSDLPAGSYIVELNQTACIALAGYPCPSPVYRGNSMTVYLSAGERKEVTLYVSRNNVNPANLMVTSPNGGETLSRGSVYPVRWNVPSLQPGQISAGNTFDIFAVRRTYGSDYQGNLRFTLVRGVFLDFGMTSGTYNWTVGQNMENMNMADGGNYFIQVCYANTLNCDESNGPWNLSGTTTTGSIGISSLSPMSGASGTFLTLFGYGFSPSGNAVRMELDGANTVYIPNYSSADGRTIYFQVPSWSSMKCQYSNPACAIATQKLVSGSYRVWVENSSGTASNQVLFYLNSNP